MRKAVLVEIDTHPEQSTLNPKLQTLSPKLQTLTLNPSVPEIP